MEKWRGAYVQVKKGETNIIRQNEDLYMKNEENVHII